MRIWKKKIAAILALLVLFVMLLSVTYVAAESNHRCEGADCPICHQICICEHVLKTLSGAASVSIMWYVLRQNLCQVVSVVSGFVRRDTLVSLKVKLSD